MTAGVAVAWIDRGAALGFLPVANDVALVEGRDRAGPGGPPSAGELAERARLLREALGEGCTVVVAVTDLPPHEAELVLGAGAYVLPVAGDFWAMPVEERLRHVGERIAVPVDDLGERIGRVRSALPRQDPVADIYAGPNPEIGTEGFADWARKVSGIRERP